MSQDLSKEAWLHLLESSVEAAAHGVLIVSRDGEIIWANPAFTQMTGYERHEVVGESPSILNSGVQDDAFYDDLWATLLAGKTWRGEIVNRRKDGSLYTERQSIQPVCFQGVDVTHFVAIKEDISEYKRLHSRVMEVDRRVAVGTLAAGVAHEINNPLAFVRSNLEILAKKLVVRHGALELDGLPAEEVGAILGDALEGTRRIQETVSDLKTFSTYEQEREVQGVDLEGAIDTAIRMVTTQIKHRARLVRDYAAQPSTVLANESQLVQVFLNLLINAAQAISVGAADDNEICVGTRRVGEEIVVEVSDTGDGISEEAMPHIFEPFFTTKPQDEGTGLGLSICRNIVRSFGARIEVESHSGAGATFRITLPAADDSALPEAPTRLVTPEVSARVVIVDDEPKLLRALQRQLGGDFEVETFSTGEQAFERLCDEPLPDIILCDLQMPGMSGVELYERLQEVSPRCAARVVFITGGALSSDRQAFLDNVAPAVLQKPLELRALYETIEQLED
jgi:PAS domain S-box-containing protein